MGIGSWELAVAYSHSGTRIFTVRPEGRDSLGEEAGSIPVGPNTPTGCPTRRSRVGSFGDHLSPCARNDPSPLKRVSRSAGSQLGDAHDGHAPPLGAKSTPCVALQGA